MAEYEEGKLYRLKELKDFEVADDDPDVRGWTVLAADNKKIGVVDELLVDTDSMKVRYLDVRVNDDISGVDNHHFLVPVGTATIDEKKDIIRTGNVQVITSLKYPKYEGGEITKDYEDSVRSSYNPDYKPLKKDKDYYNDEYYNEEKFYGSRRKKNLYRLNEIHGYEIKGIDPDIRGWNVAASDGKNIGKVYEIIVDPKVKKVRYLEVVSEINRGAADEDQHILIPVGLTNLDSKDDTVIVKMDYDGISRYPLYRGGEITRNYEETLKSSVRMDSLTSKDPDDDFYNNEYYNDAGFYGSRGNGVRWV